MEFEFALDCVFGIGLCVACACENSGIWKALVCVWRVRVSECVFVCVCVKVR